jgi:hypothetical protein
VEKMRESLKVGSLHCKERKGNEERLEETKCEENPKKNQKQDQDSR